LPTANTSDPARVVVSDTDGPPFAPLARATAPTPAARPMVSTTSDWTGAPKLGADVTVIPERAVGVGAVQISETPS
jgi:hypothetical protein